jgi:hypothetical protein
MRVLQLTEIFIQIKIQILPQSLREHASAAICGNYTNKKGSRRCTALQSKLGTWFSHLLGAAANKKYTRPSNTYLRLLHGR